MKTVSYNIRYELGLDGNIDLKRIADAVDGADIIALQEVERFWRRSGMVDQTEVLGELLPDYYQVYCPAFDIDASERGQDNSVFNRRRKFPGRRLEQR
jgi:endonuclease/exonuclease/phosphatase family metal-dependent hydrolase